MPSFHPLQHRQCLPWEKYIAIAMYCNTPNKQAWQYIDILQYILQRLPAWQCILQQWKSWRGTRSAIFTWVVAGIADIAQYMQYTYCNIYCMSVKYCNILGGGVVLHYILSFNNNSNKYTTYFSQGKRQWSGVGKSMVFVSVC